MKKILFGVLGALLVVAGANAAETTIRTATTNTVKHKVYNINYGKTTAEGGTLDGRSYRKGVIPQTNELNTARGAADITTTGVTVGNLASVTGSTGTVTAGGSGAALTSGSAPTQTIKANTANIAVLQRDKLVTPGAGNCEAGKPCGYVSTGDHTNDTTNHVWMKIEGVTVGNTTYYGNLPSSSN